MSRATSVRPRVERRDVPPGTRALDREIGELLVQLIEASKVHFVEAIAALGFTAPQAFALRTLHDPCPMRDLADVLGHDPSYITGLIDQLEERGLVERRPDPTDRRVRLLVVTEEGRRAQERIDDAMFGHLPVLDALTRAQRVQLRDLLALAVGERSPA
jgi:DNA-binding MarR family transcriptional regulator